MSGAAWGWISAAGWALVALVYASSVSDRLSVAMALIGLCVALVMVGLTLRDDR